MCITTGCAHKDPSERYLYPHAAAYGEHIGHQIAATAKTDPLEAVIPLEKLGDYRMARGLLRVLDILAPHHA